MSDVDPTRRAFLLAAGLGTGLLGLFAADDRNPDAPTVSYDREALRRVVALGHPSVPRTVPVPIGADHVARHRERAQSLLSSAPERPDIPNEAVAREYADRYENATDALARAVEARTRYERIRDLRSARWFAAEVSAVYAAFEGELTRDAVLARREPIRADLSAFRDRWRYVGDDPTVAVVVHRELESEVDYVDSMLEQAADHTHDEGSRVLRVGSTAGSVELARTALTDVTYLYDRHRDRLEDARTLGTTFDRAARALADDVAGRCPDSLPDEWESQFQRPLAYTAARELLRRTTSEIEWRCDYVREARERAGVASAVVAAGAADRDLRAFDRVRRAVRDGEYGVPRSVRAVRREKLAALEAVETALRASTGPLASRWAATASRSIRQGDDTISTAAEYDTVDVRDAARALAEYAWARARATAVPPALARVAGVLELQTPRES